MIAAMAAGVALALAASGGIRPWAVSHHLVQTGRPHDTSGGYP
jgi:hypothetical protein